jgi:hexosaminidase
VPEVQSLSHSYYLASTFREIAELPEAEYPESYCPQNPKSYEILFNVLSSVLDLTKCRSVHIGHDEWYSGGQCPRCRERDAGELFAEDVIRIASWLGERGLGAWMWADQLLPAAAASGGREQGERVVYRWPQTLAAGKLIAERDLDITLLNWYWSAGASNQDNALRDLGFRQIYGNLYGQRFEGWPERSADSSVLGGETSSWCAWNDFELGLVHYPSALYTANLLWSAHWPEMEAREAVGQQFPKLRDRLRRLWEKPRLWSEAVQDTRKHVLSIRDACNTPLKTDEWDPSAVPGV